MEDNENDIIASMSAAYDELAAQPGSDLLPDENATDPAAPAAQDGRQRDEQGRFASKGSNENAEPNEKPAGQSNERHMADAAAAAQKAADSQPQPAGGPDHSAPPQRVGAATKAAWNDLPDTIKKEIWEREERMDRGMARYSGLAEYAVEAEKNGQSLRDVMQAYKNAEDNLISNPVATLAEFCKMTNTNPLAVAQFLGVMVGGQPPVMPQSAPQGYQQVSADPRVDELLRWKQEQAQRESAREVERISSEVETFLSDTKRFPYAENVRFLMGRLIETDMAKSLEDAYQQAIYLDPSVRSLVEEQSFKSRMSAVQQSQTARNSRAAVQEAKRSAGSISGAPMAGGKSTSSNGTGPKTVADSLREAYESLAG